MPRRGHGKIPSMFLLKSFLSNNWFCINDAYDMVSWRHYMELSKVYSIVVASKE